jgi:Uma2 family endonuclease
MSQPAIRHPPVSVEEYLRLEKASPVRHEYVGGIIYALAGASKRHSRIVLNIATRLVPAARGGPCRVYDHDVKVRAAADLFYYPDLSVSCADDPGHPLIEEAPCLVVEVTSPSTERIDRREKLMAYQQIRTLQAYLIVDQERRRVERHWRDPDGIWQREEFTGSGHLAVPCPQTPLSLDEIYEGVDVSG